MLRQLFYVGLQVIDQSGVKIGEYEDVSHVEKFELPDSEYDKRGGEDGW